MTKKYIIFDVDGTLFSSIPTIIASFRQTFDRLNEPFPGDEAIKNLIGSGLDHILGQFFEGKNLEKALSTYREIYLKAQNAGIDLVPGTKKMLEKLHQNNKKIGAFTMKSRRNTIPLFKSASIDNYFEEIVGSEDVFNYKPDPEGLIKVLEYFQAKPEEAYYIGDSLYDAYSAKGANVDFLAVLTGTTNTESFKKAGFNNIFPSVKEIADYVLK